MSLDLLPVEILFKIFDDIPKYTLVSVVSRVCCLWRELVAAYIQDHLDLSAPIFVDQVDDYTVLMATRTSALVEIDLSGCVNVTESGIRCLVDRCPQLQKFIMRDSSLHGQSLQHLLSLKQLRVLNLQRTTVPFERQYRFLGFENSIKEIYFTEECLAWNWSKLQALEILELGRAREEQVSILHLCHNLTHFRVTNSSYISSSSFRGLSSIISIDFEDLSLNSLTYYPPRANWMPLIDVCLAMPNLVELRIDNIHNFVVDDECVNVIVNSCSALNSLSLLRNTQITNKSLEIIAHSLPRLKLLALKNNDAINDDGIYILSQECSQLQSISLTSCQRLTDISMSHLSHCSLLQTINVSGCVAITNTGLMFLINLQFLRELSVFGLHHSAATIRNFRTICYNGTNTEVHYRPNVAFICEVNNDDIDDNDDDDDDDTPSRSPVTHDINQRCTCPRAVCQDGCGYLIPACVSRQEHRQVCLKYERQCILHNENCRHHCERFDGIKHLQYCSAFTINCSKCGSIVPRRDIEMHLNMHDMSGLLGVALCPMRIYGCLYYSKDESNRADIITHMKSCKKHIIVCPGCRQDLQYGAWPKHSLECLVKTKLAELPRIPLKITGSSNA